ncbi:glycoside hydrolase family 79 protein [Sphaerobolus stellatus SS14]|uniref:Glycoside hydrolase family 79 protein n=1 Tax=Sphaerobolus stellatus (strain SS14) TaxID=990650 RepID=A0A0C9TX18_SPHS4|nr:glycoside hydrolase family 79 protein [Sphaerobolus stellatus SS14]
MSLPSFQDGLVVLRYSCTHFDTHVASSLFDVTSHTFYSFFSLLAYAEVIIYNQPANSVTPTTPTKVWPSVTSAQAYYAQTLTPPAILSPAVRGASAVQLVAGGMNNMSNPIPAGFFGFSLELSFCSQVLGSNGSFINPEFLNLMQHITQRADTAVVRVGGNSQEKARFFPEELAGGATILKDKSSITAPLGIVEASERLFGNRRLGLQIGNEPDLYAGNGKRNPTYGQQEYINEMQYMISLMEADQNIRSTNPIIIPNTCCLWGLADLQNLGFMDTFRRHMEHLAVERKKIQFMCYLLLITHAIPCQQLPRFDGQGYIEQYFTHASVQSFVNTFETVYPLAVQYDIPLFCTALWLINHAMQMAYYNFSRDLIHIGGQNTFYNPFVPPGALLRKGALWSVLPPYYAALIVNELIGYSNLSQVVDLFPNNGNERTPGYAVYENGQPVRAVFLNYVTDPSGANDYTVQIAIDADKVPLYYANQTFGPMLESNGIVQGIQDTKTIDCGSSNNLCSVTIPAPGAAVVFFTKEALQKSTEGATETTFETTVTSIFLHNTATIDGEVLATSNGRGGKSQQGVRCFAYCSFLPVPMTVHIMLFLKRRADLTQEQFEEYWSNIHGPVVTEANEVKLRLIKYSQFHVVPTSNEALKRGGLAVAPYDGVVEFEADTIEDFIIVIKSEEYRQKIWPHIQNFLDTNSMMYLAGEDHVKLLNQRN